eukprot:bmy_08120T0
MLQAMLRQLFQSVKEKITGAPSLECAEEILLHLEETDENFHNYEFVKYLRQYICNTLGSMIEDEIEKWTSDQNQVVESMINKFEEDEMRSQERQKKIQKGKSNSYCTDNCSDSDSSFNQSYKFCQGKLQLILDQLDPGQPKEVRYEALRALCSAPPSDVLNCENWTTLCEKLTVYLSDPDPVFSDRILKFYAQTFTLSPLHMTKEIYKSLAKYLELHFLSRENHIPTLSTGIDITHPNVIHLLKKVRLLNEYQKEAPSFWIRHPEKYMEEIVESTLSLLSVKHDQSHLVSQKILDPIHFLALVDTKAVWFKKWMHAYYSRTAVLRLIEKKYKSLITTAVQQCVQYFELCKTMKADEVLGHSKLCGNKQKTFHYSGQELQYIYFIHSLCLLGRLLIYTQGRKLFPIKLKNRKENYSPASIVTEILCILCDQKECAIECLYNNTVIEALLQPIHNLMKGTKAAPNCSETALIHVADILTRIASVEEGLILLLYGENMSSSEEKNFEYNKDVHTFLFTCFSMAWEENLLDDLLNFAATPKGLQLLQRTGAINECVTFMFNQYAKELQVSRHKKFGYGVLVTQVASTAAGAIALQSSGFINALLTELWANLECGRDDVRVTHPISTPVDPIDRSCQKDIIDRLIILNSEAKIRSLFSYEQSHIFGLRLLSVVCCDLDTLLLLEAQYQVSEMLLNAQEENTLETSDSHRDFIIDSLSVERNHVLVRINLIGGPMERILPPRMLEKGDDPYPWPMFSSYPLPNCYLSDSVTRNADLKQDNDLGKLLLRFKMSDKQTLVELLEKFVLHLSESPSECYFPSVEYTATDANVKNGSLSSVQQLGVKMTVRYGKFLNLLRDGAENDLTLVLKHCERFLKQQQASVKSSLHILFE